MSNQENPLNQPEDPRLEKAKVEAEIQKLHWEAEEIKKRVNERWYSPRFWLKQGLGAVLTAVLLVGSFFTYYQPFLKKEVDLNKLENEIEKRKNELWKLDNEREKNVLSSQKEWYQTRLLKRNVEFDSLSKQQKFTEEQRAYFSKLASEFQTELATLKEEISLRGTKLKIIYTNDRKKDVERIVDRLTKLGVNVEEIVTSITSLEMKMSSGQLHYFTLDLEGAAYQISKAISDIVKVTVGMGRKGETFPPGAPYLVLYLS